MGNDWKHLRPLRCECRGLDVVQGEIIYELYKKKVCRWAIGLGSFRAVRTRARRASGTGSHVHENIGSGASPGAQFVGGGGEGDLIRCASSESVASLPGEAEPGGQSALLAAVESAATAALGRLVAATDEQLAEEGDERVAWATLKAVSRSFEKIIRTYREDASQLCDICRQACHPFPLQPTFCTQDERMNWGVVVTSRCFPMQ